MKLTTETLKRMIREELSNVMETMDDNWINSEAAREPLIEAYNMLSNCYPCDSDDMQEVRESLTGWFPNLSEDQLQAVINRAMNADSEDDLQIPADEMY